MCPDEDRCLLDRPLRSLPPEDLARYAAKALNTWGGVEEFRYFVPRRRLELVGDHRCDPAPARVRDR
ncbi:hypothetical protein [Actinoallomurus sp. NPDC050550]|uniref:hypothetical protein n=1 Tax=Actinoallomurus sp. NPDC050550 TaxID=3154937 RepID=UPI0033C011E8